MILPTLFHIGLWFVLASLGLAAFFFPAAGRLWLPAAGMAFGAALLDALFSRRRPAVELERVVHHNLPVTVWSKVTMKITNRGRQTLSLEIHDHCHPDFTVKDLPRAVGLAPGQCATLDYQVFPTKRGHYNFSGTDVIVASPLHLWQKKWFFPHQSETKVFPNFREIHHFALLATHHHLSLMGIKKLTKRGEGSEFHQLREYRQGESLQKIDWKATSRYRRLISKDYQDERDQQVIFVLDCGRRMHHVESGKSHLDQALNSILLLAYVAARQGDGVGFYSFGGSQKWLPPRKQGDSVRALLLTMYDVESSTDASDYLQATQDLLALQGRRSLMVIITSTRAEDHDDLLTMARQLRRKHLVIIADLRENILDDTLNAPIPGFFEAVRYEALQHYLGERRNLLQEMRHAGIHALDVSAGQLPAAIVNSYLEIKSAGSL
jgi:uncharacterized protein (DUF58 family)